MILPKREHDLHSVPFFYFFKKTIMQRLTNEQKAELYNKYLYQYERVQEEIRQIKAKNFEVSEKDQKEIDRLDVIGKKIFNETKKLYL
jgi:hypothetical protein